MSYCLKDNKVIPTKQTTELITQLTSFVFLAPKMVCFGDWNACNSGLWCVSINNIVFVTPMVPIGSRYVQIIMRKFFNSTKKNTMIFLSFWYNFLFFHRPDTFLQMDPRWVIFPIINKIDKSTYICFDDKKSASLANSFYWTCSKYSLRSLSRKYFSFLLEVIGRKSLINLFAFWAVAFP